ncbi:hypothetical protein R4514_05330 [Acinetobacter baumannii]|nr:hypothetical protein [Acinetobacter baumannii]
MTSSIVQPYAVITDVDGKPLDAGYVYIGEEGKNPEVYPIPIFWDHDLTIPAPQPIRTRNGYFSRNGIPAKIFTNVETCSVTVKNKKQYVIYTDLTSSLLVDLKTLNESLANLQLEIDEVGKFTQPETGFTTRTSLNKMRDIQNSEDYTTPQDAFNAKRSSTTALSLALKEYSLTGPLSLTAYHYIQGKGFNSGYKFSGAGNGIVYTAGTGLQDDHSQRSLRDFQIRGDNTVGGYLDPKNGTTTGYSVDNTGHLAETKGLLLNGHAIGLKLNSTYTNVNRLNYYRACITGLDLGNITSHREEMIYGRYCSSAAAHFHNSLQNITLAGGAIEGNRGRAIWVKDVPDASYPKLTIDDVYLESNGDLAANVPAVDIQNHPKLHVDVRAGSYWNNSLSGITNGAYKWGKSVSFANSSLNGFHYADVTRVRYCMDSAMYNTSSSQATATAIGLTEPTMMLEYSPNWRVDGIGPIFQVPNMLGRPARKLVAPNLAKLTYPHITTMSGATTVENTSLDYGEGSWSDITFPATGDFNSNNVTLASITDTTSDYMGKVHVFLMKPATDCDLGIVATGVPGLVVNQSYFRFKAGVTYRICCMAHRVSSQNYIMRLFSLNGAATVSYFPIYTAKFKTPQETINFTNMFCTGAL